MYLTILIIIINTIIIIIQVQIFFEAFGDLTAAVKLLSTYKNLCCDSEISKIFQVGVPCMC